MGNTRKPGAGPQCSLAPKPGSNEAWGKGEKASISLLSSALSLFLIYGKI